MKIDSTRKQRRHWFKQVRDLGLLALGFCLSPISAFAKKEDALAAIQKISGGAPIRTGKVTLTIPLW